MQKLLNDVWNVGFALFSSCALFSNKTHFMSHIEICYCDLNQHRFFIRLVKIVQYSVIVKAGKRPMPIKFFLCLENVFTFGSILKIYYVVQCHLNLVSPPPSVKIQIMGGKVCLRCKCKTLLVVVNKLLKTKSLLTPPSNVLPCYFK